MPDNTEFSRHLLLLATIKIRKETGLLRGVSVLPDLLEDGVMRYESGMSGFVERTDFEAGFAAQWDRYLAPAIGVLRAGRRRRMLFASLTTVAGAALICAAVVIWSVAPDFGPRLAALTQPVFAALVVALAALAMIGAWVPLLGRDETFDEQLEAALQAHIAAVMRPSDNAGFASLIIEDLSTSGILPTAPFTISSHYAGCNAQHRLHLLQADFDIPKVGKKVTKTTCQRVVVMRVSLAAAVQGDIHIDSNVPRLSAMQRSSDGRFARFHVDHDEFDVVFGVIAVDLQQARGLLSPDFADRLLALHRNLINPLATGRGAGGHMSGLFADACLTLVIELPEPPVADEQSVTTASLEQDARSRLARFAALSHLADILPHEMVLPLPGPVSLDGHQPLRATARSS